MTLCDLPLEAVGSHGNRFTLWGRASSPVEGRYSQSALTLTSSMSARQPMLRR